MSDTRPYIGVGAVVVDRGRLLLVQRGKDPGRGLWSLPGGRLEAGEHLVDAVAREVREETGIEVEVGELLGIHEVLGDPHYVVHDYIATVIGDPAPRPSHDAADARWVPLEEVGSLELTPRFVETLTGWGVLPESQPEKH